MECDEKVWNSTVVPMYKSNPYLIVEQGERCNRLTGLWRIGKELCGSEFRACMMCHSIHPLHVQCGGFAALRFGTFPLKAKKHLLETRIMP